MNRLPLATLFAAACLLATFAACGDDRGSNTADNGARDVSGDASVTPDTASDAAGPDTDTIVATCNPITAEGCAEGQTCSYNPDSDTPLCVAKGVLAATAGCGDGLGTCDHGICLSLNDTGNLCYEFCERPTHCSAGSACLSLTGSPYKVCKISGIYKNCELMGDAECGAGKGCYATADEPDPICLKAGTAADGEGCGNDANGCKAGLACVNQGCTRLCDKTAAKPCGDEFTQCSSYLGAFPNVGICVKQ